MVLMISGGPSSRSSLSPCPGERRESPETSLDLGSIREIEIPLQSPRATDGLYQCGKLGMIRHLSPRI